MDSNFIASPAAPQQSSKSSMWKMVVAVVVLVAALALFWFYGKNQLMGGQVLGADNSYQAVFLTNGQVYFGKLSSEGSWLILKDIYYLQVTQQLQPAPEGTEGIEGVAPEQTTQPNIQLVKLGSELHGPEDVMYVDRDKILFWENMKADSKVVEAIAQYQADN